MAKTDHTHFRKTRHTLATNLISFIIAVLISLPSILRAEEAQTPVVPDDAVILPESGTSEKSAVEDMAFRKFRVRIKELLAEEALLVDANEKNRESVISLFKLKNTEGRKTKKNRKKIKKELNCLEHDLETLIDNWKKLDLPDEKFFLLKGTKLLRLSTFRLHIEDKKRIINTWDPTDVEYAVEHYKQSQLFEEKFQKLFNEIEPDMQK